MMKKSNSTKSPNLAKRVLVPVYLTVSQLENACKEHSFILVRFKSGELMGINTKVADIILKKRNINRKAKTDYIGFIPCDFQTYISHKHRFC